MNAKLFGKVPGEYCTDRMEVFVDNGCVLVGAENGHYPSTSLKLTPANAKEIGRALIKAGKFIEKEAAK